MTTAAKARRALIYSVTVTFISLLAMSGFVVGFTQWQIDENNKRSCDLIETSLLPRPTPPDPNLSTATTEYGQALREYNARVLEQGKALQRTFSDLYNEYECEEK